MHLILPPTGERAFVAMPLQYRLQFLFLFFPISFVSAFVPLHQLRQACFASGSTTFAKAIFASFMPDVDHILDALSADR